MFIFNQRLIEASAESHGDALKLYFLGHMAWAYVFAMLAWAFIPGVKRAGKLFVPAILMLGILPDADLLLGSLGIVHHTVTHSFFFWILLFIPVFVVLRLKSVPYFVAVLQHFAFGDLLMDKVMLFWPFSGRYFGFDFGMPSLIDVLLETAGLVLSLGIIIYVGDLKRLFSIDRNNAFMLLPLLALAVSAVFYTQNWPSTSSFITHVFSNNFLITLAIGHIILFSFIATSTLQGLRATKLTNRKEPDKPKHVTNKLNLFSLLCALWV
jgi:hypothetical protein